MQITAIGRIEGGSEAAVVRRTAGGAARARSLIKDSGGPLDVAIQKADFPSIRVGARKLGGVSVWPDRQPAGQLSTLSRAGVVAVLRCRFPERAC